MTIDCSTPSSERSTDTILKSLADAEIEALVAELETRGGTKVLHELVPLPFHRHGPHDGLRCAIIVDTETTGLVMPLVGPSEPKRETNAAPHAEIVSLAMVAIAYDPDDGVIKGAIGRFHAFNEPSHPIPPAATAIHGITDDDVRGKTISALEVAEFISLSAASVQSGVMFGSRDEAKLPLVIAHNARFDRRMLEHHFPSIFPDLPWACSQTQVPWTDHGFEGTKLFYLGFKAGFYFGNRHSASADADAVVALLRQSLAGRTAMAMLRDAARRTSYRLSIVTRFDPAIIAAVKQRDYRWSPAEGGKPGAWSWQGDDVGLGKEIEFLDAAGFGEIRQIHESDGFDRFSSRE